MWKERPIYLLNEQWRERVKEIWIESGITAIPVPLLFFFDRKMAIGWLLGVFVMAVVRTMNAEHGP